MNDPGFESKKETQTLSWPLYLPDMGTVTLVEAESPMASPSLDITVEAETGFLEKSSSNYSLETLHRSPGPRIRTKLTLLKNSKTKKTEKDFYSMT
jgi:hypothetical protein